MLNGMDRLMLVDLQVVHLYGNCMDKRSSHHILILLFFVGNIPTEIGALTELTYLDLEGNSLSGKIRTTLHQNPIQ